MKIRIDPNITRVPAGMESVPPVEVEAEIVGDNIFAIHETPDEWLSGIFPIGVQISHIPSGCLIAFRIPDVEEARLLCERLLEIDVDWKHILPDSPVPQNKKGTILLTIAEFEGRWHDGR